MISGTAANSLAVSAMCPPWGSVLCHEAAHIYRSEWGATSMLGGGAVLRGLPGEQFKLHPASLQTAFAATNWSDPHHSQPSAVSLTCPTDMGTVYSLDEVRAVSAIAREQGLRMHLDGARMANALPAVSEQLVYRVKRAGHVASKMRYQSAQLQAYLSDGLWLSLAARANQAMVALAAGLRELGVRFVPEPQANMLFADVGQHVAASLAAAGLLFHQSGDVIRLVTSFQTTESDVREILRRAAPSLT